MRCDAYAYGGLVRFAKQAVNLRIVNTVSILCKTRTQRAPQWSDSLLIVRRGAALPCFRYSDRAAPPAIVELLISISESLFAYDMWNNLVFSYSNSKDPYLFVTSSSKETAIAREILYMYVPPELSAELNCEYTSKYLGGQKLTWATLFWLPYYYYQSPAFIVVTNVHIVVNYCILLYIANNFNVFDSNTVFLGFTVMTPLWQTLFHAM